MTPYHRSAYGYALISLDRFNAKIEETETCWLWTGAIQSRGYGSFGIDGTTYLAHRVAYWLWRGHIDDGLTINHLCGVKRCVNPQHLEAVTQAENNAHARATGLAPYPTQAARNAAKTSCANGHPFTPENTYHGPSGRRCRTCKRASDNRRRANRDPASRAIAGGAPVPPSG